jgi:hypothetical protein
VLHEPSTTHQDQVEGFSMVPRKQVMLERLLEQAVLEEPLGGPPQQLAAVGSRILGQLAG